MEYQAQPHMTPPDVWTLTLNKYQRDNLLNLLQNIMEGDRRPVTWFHTGDWVGEIRWMLGKKTTSHHGASVEHIFEIDEGDRPNCVREFL